MDLSCVQICVNTSDSGLLSRGDPPVWHRFQVLFNSEKNVTVLKSHSQIEWCHFAVCWTFCRPRVHRDPLASCGIFSDIRSIIQRLNMENRRLIECHLCIRQIHHLRQSRIYSIQNISQAFGTLQTHLYYICISQRHLLIL